MLALAGRWTRRDLDDYDSPAMGVVVWLEPLSGARLRELAGLLAASATDPTGRSALPDRVWLPATLDCDELAQVRDREQLEQTLEATTVRPGMLTPDSSGGGSAGLQATPIPPR